MRRLALLVLLLCGAARADHAEAWPPGTAEKMLGEVLHDNAVFAEHHGRSFYAPFQDGQRPRVTLVSCSDSRVQMHAFDATPDNDVFQIRNIGNQYDNNKGSIEYGVRALHTPLLVFLGHVGCGAVKAALGDQSALPEVIRNEVRSVASSIATLDTTDKCMPAAEKLHSAVELNVHSQVARALKQFEAEVRDGKLVVVGAVYDFKDEFHKGPGRIVVIDYNGEKDLAAIAKALKEKKAPSNGSKLARAEH